MTIADLDNGHGWVPPRCADPDTNHSFMIDVVEVLADLWVNHLTLFIERLAVGALPLATLDTLPKDFDHCNETAFSQSSDFPQSPGPSQCFRYVSDRICQSFDTAVNWRPCMRECVRVWQQLAIAFPPTDTQWNKQITFAQSARSAYLCLFDGPLSHVCTSDYRERIEYSIKAIKWRWRLMPTMICRAPFSRSSKSSPNCKLISDFDFVCS